MTTTQTTYEKNSAKLGIVSTRRFGPSDSLCAVDGGPAMPWAVSMTARIKAFAHETEPMLHEITIDRPRLEIMVVADGKLTADHDISVADQVALLTGHYRHLYA